MYFSSHCWLVMVFLSYTYLLAIRLHFTYSIMAIMAVPLAHDHPDDRQPCPDAVLDLTRNSTEYGVNTERLNWTVRQQAIVMGAYYLGMLLSAFPGGVYANRDHERSILLVCMTATATTMALMPFASVKYDCWTAAMVLRFIQGCSFGPTGPCGGTMAGKIIPKSKRSLYSTFMYSGTLFGGFFGHIFSGLVIPLVSNDGSFFMLSVFGFIWTVVWTTMIHMTPYVRTHDASNHSMMLFSTPWSTILQTPSFISLLVACMGFGYLYSFITTAIPIYFAKILGGDYIKNGISVSINWFICWLTAIFAGLLAASLTNVHSTSTKTIVRKVYAGIVLILSPMMLLGVMLADCDKSLVRNFLRMSVILLAFERASLRINALDLCPGYAGSLIALCDVFYSIGNAMDLVIARNWFSWNYSFLASIILPITCSVLFMLLASSRNQCWNPRYRRSSSSY